MIPKETVTPRSKYERKPLASGLDKNTFSNITVSPNKRSVINPEKENNLGYST